MVTAKALLTALHREHPGIFAVDESLGLLYVAQENYADALPLLQAAVREQPSSDVAHANLGAAFFKVHRNQEALEEFQRAAQLNPKNPATQQSLGTLWLEQDKPKLAADAFAAALREQPDNSDLRINYATALVAAGDGAKAEELLANIAGKDNSAPAQSVMGEIAEQKGKFKEAVQHLDRAVQLEPSEANVWMLGAELLRHWTFDAAIPEFEAAIAKFPQSARIRFGLGAAYFGGGRFAAAIPVFADLLQADKDNPLYAELLGMSCTAVSASEKKACDQLLVYAEAHPKDAKANTYAASMLLTETSSEDKQALAATLLDHALAANPKLAEAQYQAGVLQQNRGDWAASIHFLESAIALKPELAQAHYRLALAYWRTGRKQEGQAQMDLQKKYAKQEAEDLDRRLHQITTFVVDVRK